LVFRLERLTESSDLPESPDHDAVDRYLTRAYRHAWSAG
jgi:hypothetical protein